MPAEIGVGVVVYPPQNNQKTLKRVHIQASTSLWPSDIEHTTGSKLILSGPHSGTIEQNGKTLITAEDLSGIVSPYHLYIYTDINVDIGSVKNAAAYGIDTITQDGSNYVVRIHNKFHINRGGFGSSEVVNFLIVRGWLDAPRDYVVNDAALVSPPAGDLYTEEPYQQFYKTTQGVYIRARYINNDGGGGFLYWDGFKGTTVKANAVKFTASGITAAPPPKHALKWTTNINLRPAGNDSVRWNNGAIKFSDGDSQLVSNANSPVTLSPAANNGVWYVYKRFESNTLQFTQVYTTAVGPDRIPVGIIVSTATVGGSTTVIVEGDSGGPHISAQSIAVNVLSALTGNIGNITSGTITGVLIQTATAGQRVVLNSTDNVVDIYDPDELVGRLGVFSDPGGVHQDYFLMRAFGLERDLGITSERDIRLFTKVQEGTDQFRGTLELRAGIIECHVGSTGYINLIGGDIRNVGDIELDSVRKDGSGNIEINSNIDMNNNFILNAQLIGGGGGSGGPPFTANVDFQGFSALNVGDINLDSISKDGSGRIDIDDDIEFDTSADIYFKSNEQNDIGTDSVRAANIWANACILDAVALRDNQNFSAQAGRSILYISGSGSSRRLRVRWPDGSFDTLATQ